MNSPTCRNCQHAVWVMSPSGKQIKQRTPGECGKFKELARLALATETAPAVQIMAFKRDIWPLTPALKCPGFVRKPSARLTCPQGRERKDDER